MQGIRFADIWRTVKANSVEWKSWIKHFFIAGFYNVSFTFHAQFESVSWTKDKMLQAWNEMCSLTCWTSPQEKKNNTKKKINLKCINWKIKRISLGSFWGHVQKNGSLYTHARTHTHRLGESHIREITATWSRTLSIILGPLKPHRCPLTCPKRPRPPIPFRHLPPTLHVVIHQATARNIKTQHIPGGKSSQPVLHMNHTGD